MPQSKDQCVSHSDYLILGTLGKQGCQHREARKIFLHNPHTLLWLPCMFLFCSNSVDCSISSWTKWWTLVLGMLAMFGRQCVNEAVEVSFESRMAQVSAIFHIFKCTFCLLWLVLLFPYCFRHHPWLFCSRSLLFQCIFLSSIDHSIHTSLHTCTTSNPTVYALFPNSLPISFLSFVSVLPQVVLCHDLCVRDVCCYLLYSLCLCCRLYRREWKKHRIWSGKAAVFSNKNVPNMCCTSLNKRPIMWPHICRSQTVFCKPLKWANCSWKLHFYCQIW